MGGLVARVYLTDEGGADRVGHLVAAGTPWFGSVRVFELLDRGYGPATALVGGIDLVRATLLSFPSIYELAPAYDGCCAAEGGFVPGDPATWGALGWQALPAGQDLARAAERKARLAAIVATPLPPGVDEAVAIGVDNRTAEAAEFHRDGAGWSVAIRTGWSGDGIVVPLSARAGERAVYPTSFSGHQAILADPDVQDFVLAALRDGPAVALRDVPVRPRDEIATTLGRLVALVGVAVDTDAPAYAAGEAVTVRVILRPGEMDPVDGGLLTLDALHPDGRVEPIALARDPVGTPNPFEQVFAGQLGTGAEPALHPLRAVLEVARSEDRIVELAVPILPR
jgi:hypothetical protein